jgi:hypothetical protein
LIVSRLPVVDGGKISSISVGATGPKFNGSPLRWLAAAEFAFLQQLIKPFSHFVDQQLTVQKKCLSDKTKSSQMKLKARLLP